MAKFTEQLQIIVEDYRAAGQPWPASTQEMAEWAVAHDRYQLMRGMAVSQCASKIGRAMGMEHVRDKKVEVSGSTMQRACNAMASYL